MHTKHCSFCKSLFETSSAKRIFCSDLCKSKDFYSKFKRSKKQYDCIFCGKRYFRSNTIQKFCSKECSNQSRIKPINLNTCKKHLDKNIGYVRVYFPKHPKANNRGFVYEHRVIMEKHLGRYLTEEEVVHHKNHIRWDNRIENLEVLDRKEHSKEKYKLYSPIRSLL